MCLDITNMTWQYTRNSLLFRINQTTGDVRCGLFLKLSDWSKGPFFGWFGLLVWHSVWCRFSSCSMWTELNLTKWHSDKVWALHFCLQPVLEFRSAFFFSTNGYRKDGTKSPSPPTDAVRLCRAVSVLSPTPHKVVEPTLARRTNTKLSTPQRCHFCSCAGSKWLNVTCVKIRSPIEIV